MITEPLVDVELDHTPDGQPVKVWQQVSAWKPYRVETFLEVGHLVIKLDHLDPGLIPALSASLRRRAA